METLPQLEGSSLSRVLRENGFQLCPGITGHWFVIKAPSLAEAYSLAEDDAIASAATKTRIFIKTPETEELLEATPLGDVMTVIETPSILQLGGQPRMTLGLLRACEEILTYPARSMGIVRLADNHQIGVSPDPDESFLIAGTTAVECSTWRREEYWDLEALERFMRETRQSMEPNSQNWTEFSYRARVKPGSDMWLQLTTRYRLISDGLGEYHLAENLDMAEIGRIA